MDDFVTVRLSNGLFMFHKKYVEKNIVLDFTSSIISLFGPDYISERVIQTVNYLIL